MHTGSWNIDNIANIPVTALYDFCNAFPTLLHKWIFLVLKALKLPEKFICVIWWLYTDVTAYSSGVGDGSFLFDILGGAKTGCPASSVLFLLAVNPIVDLFLLLCDGPKLSNTRFCADDIGSALRKLCHIKRQASIFGLAARVAGLHLKDVKCVLVFTGLEVNEELKAAVTSWLHDNVPAFEHFKVGSSGKFLGWFLGISSSQLSFVDPLKKYSSRVLDICDGKAPSTVSLLRYNQRAVTVLSYVAQFASPPESFGIDLKEQHALHKILRLPPNSLPRPILHTLKSFTCVDPIPLADYCSAVMFRFAFSEKDYLSFLACSIRDLIGDNMPLAFSSWIVPDGGLRSPPILQSLFEALALKGNHLRLKTAVSGCAAGHWLLTPVSSLQFGEDKCSVATEAPKTRLQSKVLEVLQVHRQPDNLAPLFTTKAVTTLGDSLSQQIHLCPAWFGMLRVFLGSVKVFIRVCWLKTIAGGWTTTYRMHEEIKWPCIFGCSSTDELRHYFECPILWQLATEHLGSEDSIFVGERLCLSHPSVLKLKTLALCHFIYHSCKNDEVCARLINCFCANPLWVVEVSPSVGC